MDSDHPQQDPPPGPGADADPLGEPQAADLPAAGDGSSPNGGLKVDWQDALSGREPAANGAANHLERSRSEDDEALDVPPSRRSRGFSVPPSRRTSAWFYRLADIQIRYPYLVLGVAAVLVVVALSLTLRLRLKPGFEALLPESRPSVQELNRVKQHTTGISTIFIVLEGDDTAALRRAADALVPAVLGIGRPWVGSAESGVHEAVEFLQPRAGLFTELSKLQKLHDDVEERWRYEVGKKAGTIIEDEGYVPPEFSAASLKKRFGLSDQDLARWPGGYYQSKDGKAVVVAIRSGVLGTNYEQGSEAIRRVRAAVDGLDLQQRFHPSIRYGLSGDLVTAMSAYTAINEDLTDVGLLGGLFIIGVVFLYYLRMRTLLSMLLTIAIGVLCTFGATQLLIGHLNMATGFLFTIVAGNGINPGIIFMARFLEARRRGISAPNAIRESHRETWLPTLTASCAAAAAYASLLVTEFRGFRDFGAIGGIGMVLCWLCTFAFLPSILIVAERVSPLHKSESGLFGLLPKATAGGTRFGLPFAALVARFPRAATVLGSVLAIAGTVATVRYIQGDPMEYNLANLRTDMSERLEEVRLTKLSEEITGFVGIDGMAILVDRTEQVPWLVAALEKLRDAAPAAEKPFKEVVTLQDFVPANQKAKIPLLTSLKDYLLRSRQRGFIKDKDWQDLKPFLPPDSLQPFGIEDLPAGMAQAFTEADGTRGRIVYITPISSEAVDDARYLFRWADSYRRTELSDRSVVLGSGRAVIYADIWAAILNDVPRAVLVSLLLTLVVVALAFRAGKAAATVMGALLIGVAWMTGMLVVAEAKLNFLNFIALPITFGIGVDYAVNVMQRYRREGPGSALTAVRETGGAVILCSLTTTLGYLALVTSVNYAVRSLGIAAVLGEIACLLAAVIVLPGALIWRDRRRPPAAGDAGTPG